jgi:alkyl hydroperoxide reductase subunit AhpF
MSQQITWMEEADVVVVGYGGAGAAAAVTTIHPIKPGILPAPV